MGSAAGFSGLPRMSVNTTAPGVSALRVGVAGDTEFALVVEPVVAWAQADQVPGVGRSVVTPVDDVMYLRPAGL
ncbi:MAG: hypothetical protein M3508_13440 [Actinomycetota bacterium]|nr:hypothetical protein [Actinomycetota bacterium]